MTENRGNRRNIIWFSVYLVMVINYLLFLGVIFLLKQIWGPINSFLVSNTGIETEWIPIIIVLTLVNILYILFLAITARRNGEIIRRKINKIIPFVMIIIWNMMFLLLVMETGNDIKNALRKSFLPGYSMVKADYDIPEWCDTGKTANPYPGLRHRLAEDGTILWNVKKDKYLPHSDHIEMAGLKVATIVSYGVNREGALMLNRHIVWPTLRIIPNDTHGFITRNYDISYSPDIIIDDKNVTMEKPSMVKIRGSLAIKSETGRGISIVRKIFPSVDKPAIVEKWTLKNEGAESRKIEIKPRREEIVTKKQFGVHGSYRLLYDCKGKGELVLKPGSEIDFYAAFSGQNVKDKPFILAWDKEEKKRDGLVNNLFGKLILDTPDRILNRAFDFAKLRGAESIFDTRGGLMHGPGGGLYYAAIWTNDQIQYINPFFPFLGYDIGNESAINSFRLFKKYLNKDFTPVPSSVIAEGTDAWSAAGDRGDAAMLGAGAARFALLYGDRKIANELWRTIEWTLEFCRKKITKEGVVASDSDELEGRFPSGKMNLSTSSIAYSAFLYAALLGKELNKPAEVINKYNTAAARMKQSIERYFGADIEGYKTYRYYEGNNVLRAWICIPLTVGIFDRAGGTIDALFSSRLWTKDGLATQAGIDTFWDRSTLFALRGVLAAGETEQAMEKLKRYTERRFLGDHVPYPVEAYPEGNQKHLSAEGGLYCRIFTEGLFGIDPTGFRSFNCNPRLPEKWNRMALRNIHAFGSKFDLVVNRTKEEEASP